MIAQTMRAALVSRFEQLLCIEEMKVKRPDRNQIPIKVVAGGVYHTDLHAIDGDSLLKIKFP